jgi:hypothetical protein
MPFSAALETAEIAGNDQRPVLTALRGKLIGLASLTNNPRGQRRRQIPICSGTILTHAHSP